MNLLQPWLFSLLLSELKRYLNKLSFSKQSTNSPKHIFFCLVDHFEPGWKRPGHKVETERVNNWAQKYPKIAKRHFDCEGRHPKHIFFYPQEEYQKQHLDILAEICHRGFAEVEIHLHHENDTPDGLKKKLIDFKNALYNYHGLLSIDKNTKEIKYAFIHGNWALDNSRRDGRWCGVNNELQVLKETGCYADFTLPSAPSDTQTVKINSIYYAIDDPTKPKSHDTGVDVSVRGGQKGDLILIQGPLCLSWKRRKWFFLPRLENGSLIDNNPPYADRVDLWISRNIHVQGKSNWIFVKVYTHGCQEGNMKMLLDGGLDFMFSYLASNYNDKKKFFLHYVTCREMYNIIKALEQGELTERTDFNMYRNYELIFGQKI